MALRLVLEQPVELLFQLHVFPEFSADRAIGCPAAAIGAIDFEPEKLGVAENAFDTRQGLIERQNYLLLVNFGQFVR